MNLLNIWVILLSNVLGVRFFAREGLTLSEGKKRARTQCAEDRIILNIAIAAIGFVRGSVKPPPNHPIPQLCQIT
jgi:hypothetical protein